MSILQIAGFPFGPQMWADSSSIVTSATNYDMWTKQGWVVVGFNPSSVQSEGWAITITVKPVSTI